MPGAGEYQDRLTVYKRSVVEQDNGQLLPTYTATGFVWGDVVHDGSNREDRYGADRPTVSITIRLRGYPDVSALDRLYSEDWDEVYLLVSKKRGDNELIYDADLIDGFDLDRMEG